MKLDFPEAVSTFQFFEFFPEQDAAIEFLEAVRWPDKVICPRCENSNTTQLKKTHRHLCRDCRWQFSVRSGTVFESSHVPLHKWLYAMFLLQTARKGISSIQLSKELGITQKTAWFLLHRLREAMYPEDTQLNGVVEIDETLVGGREANKHFDKKLWEKWPQGKQILIGFRERDGAIIIWPISTEKAEFLEPDVHMAVAEGATIYTDESRAYNALWQWYQHETVRHSAHEYARVDVTTNGIESVWAVLKRGHKGIYHHWSPKHSHRYANEFAFRLVDGKTSIPIMVRVQRLAERACQTRIT
ncbi:MAG: IS1595 family transposase [Caldilineaceae bacterium SB0662_bin_25]|nr:IS1595 family transposase [Caldilineaceae bacterium SB0662_bin_25]